MSSLQRAPVSDREPAPLSLFPTTAGPTTSPAMDSSPLGVLGMQSMLGNAGALDAISRSSRKKTTTTPELDPAAEDRKKAATELADRFEVVGDDFKGKRLSNQVTQAEYDKICSVYSDVRMGKGDLTIDASKYSKKADQDRYKTGAMNDIASLLQTEAGRGLVYQLHDNATQKDKKGDPIHRHTTLTPLLNRDGTVDKTNGYAAPNDYGSDAKVGRDGKLTPNTGTDVTISYNPGVNVGDAYKEYQSANPWLAGFRSDVILMHEGNHAMKMTAGMCDPRTVARTDNASNTRDPKMAQDASAGISRTEHQAVGLGLYANDPLTENAYRAERRSLATAGAKGVQASDKDLVQRTSYTPTPGRAAVAPPSSDPLGTGS